jgi:hypothetical protein
MNSRSPQRLAQLREPRGYGPLSTLAIERHGAAARVKRGTAAGRGTFGLCGHFPGAVGDPRAQEEHRCYWRTAGAPQPMTELLQSLPEGFPGAVLLTLPTLGPNGAHAGRA